MPLVTAVKSVPPTAPDSPVPSAVSNSPLIASDTGPLSVAVNVARPPSATVTAATDNDGFGSLSSTVSVCVAGPLPEIGTTV